MPADWKHANEVTIFKYGNEINVTAYGNDSYKLRKENMLEKLLMKALKQELEKMKA